MRRKSNNPELDKILENQYNECYTIALDGFKDKSPEFIASFCKSQMDDAKYEEFTYRNKRTFEEKLDVVLKMNAAHALIDACKKLLKPNNVN